MIMKITQIDNSIDYFQISNFSHGNNAENPEESIYYMVRYEGDDYEFSNIEFCINEDDGLKSFRYQSIELLTDSLTVIKRIEFDNEYYKNHKDAYPVNHQNIYLC